MDKNHGRGEQIHNQLREYLEENKLTSSPGDMATAIRALSETIFFSDKADDVIKIAAEICETDLRDKLYGPAWPVGKPEETKVGTKIELGKDYVLPGGGHTVDFKCECGCTVLEEIMGGVTHTSTILKIATEDGEYDANYGNSSQEDGEVESIQCQSCGKRYGSSLDEVVESYQKALFPPVKRKHLKD